MDVVTTVLVTCLLLMSGIMLVCARVGGVYKIFYLAGSWMGSWLYWTLSVPCTSTAYKPRSRFCVVFWCSASTSKLINTNMVEVHFLIDLETLSVS